MTFLRLVRWTRILVPVLALMAVLAWYVFVVAAGAVLQ